MIADIFKLHEQLTKQINDTRDRLTINMQSGNYTDFAEYKYVVGQYRGLTVAQNMLDELVKKIEGSDDD